MAKYNLFGDAWLSSPDEEGEFPTNGDRFAAQELRKRQDQIGFTRKGFILQAIAAGWHHKTPAQLKALADQVGRERIQVIHGTADRMLTSPHAEILRKELNAGAQPADGGVRYTMFEGNGHVLLWEKRKEFTRLIEDLVRDAEALNRDAGIREEWSVREREDN